MNIVFDLTQRGVDFKQKGLPIPDKILRKEEIIESLKKKEIGGAIFLTLREISEILRENKNPKKFKVHFLLSENKENHKYLSLLKRKIERERVIIFGYFLEDF